MRFVLCRLCVQALNTNVCSFFFVFFCVCDFSLQYNTVGVIMVWVSESDTVSVGPAAIYYAHTIFNKSDVMPTRPVTPTRFFISESDLSRQHHYTLFYPPPLHLCLPLPLLSFCLSHPLAQWSIADAEIKVFSVEYSEL